MIKGSKVKIRDRRLSDARNEYNWMKDPELAKLDAAPPIRMSFSEYLVEFNSDFHYPCVTRQRFAIETLEGKHIGNCSFYNISPDKRETELGIMIGDRDYWNKGYGEDTIRLLVNYIFERQKLNRVYLKTLDWNLRAHACFKKCGFMPFGTLVRDGYSFLLMEVNREDWEKKQEQAAKETAVIESW